MNARRLIPNGGHHPPQRLSSRRIWCLWVVIAMWPLSWVVFMHGAVTNHFNQYNVVDDETFRNEQHSSSTYQNTARTRELTTNKNSSSPPGVELTASSSSVTPEKTQPNTTTIEKATPATTNSKPSLPKTVPAVDTDSTATKDATSAITATAATTTTTTTTTTTPTIIKTGTGSWCEPSWPTIRAWWAGSCEMAEAAAEERFPRWEQTQTQTQTAWFGFATRPGRTCTGCYTAC